MRTGTDEVNGDGSVKTRALDPPARVVREAQTLAVSIAGRRDEIEDARRIPMDIVAALRDIGCFRMFVPAAFGGDELGLWKVCR